MKVKLKAGKKNVDTTGNKSFVYNKVYDYSKEVNLFAN